MTDLISDPTAILIAIFVVVVLWALFCAGGFR